MIKEFFEEKKYILPSVLLLIYATFVTVTFGKWGNVFYDCFRELIIPKAVLEGKVLYSDITCLYPPLAYQLNALLFKIFGCSLNVLYAASITCTLGILTLLYKIIEKYSSSLVAFIVVLSVMEIFTFRIFYINFASWFFPYSFSFLYAFFSCLIAFYIYTLYKENNSRKCLYLSAFFAGLSLAFKLDCICFALLLVFEIFKNRSFKDFVYCLGLYLLPVILTYGIWFVSGGSVDGLIQYKNFIINFMNAPSVLQFNKNYLFQTINIPVIVFLAKSSVYFFISMFSLAVVVISAFFCERKIKNYFFKIIAAIAFLLICIFVLKKVCFIQYGIVLDANYNLVIIPYIVLISALTILFLKFKKKNYTDKEKTYFILSITAFLMSFRTFALIFVSYIGNFIMVVYWMAFLYLLFEIIPDYFPNFKKNAYKTIISLIVLLYGLSYTMMYLAIAEKKSYPIKNQNEVFYTTKAQANAINQVINYIKTNTPKESTVLVADEGTVINYFSERKINLKYYALIPHIIDTYGEENIIKDLRKNPPDYVIISNNYYICAGYFGIDYAKKLLQYFWDNYNKTEIIEYSDNNSKSEFVILKKK